ncbi:AraC family transcriptional regulator [Pseudomonas sp. GD04087]|uniref:AraC family transcriptional regulator n=1 Tax=Pseudomonas TaxID=286 RepID=UPI001F386AA9|nr:MULTISPECIES: AraC family transcriptional regulator [Pseudomonas]MCP1648011.1 AraC-like DNA-binding protein [Pseudomonas nitroreducens]MCP1686587.1 AraC-like DNA-binding protein [Pseudomonas nitroreducens]MDH0293120.1 AraC family transcriptional regulator [Pseudomonas sp. GD04087]MDH1052815.1 AraC family transcriptional regulator [Pseudomonas sp. GD03903]MDH2003351.1 AraC family transcriptional regulator [Pseudomonas sp. GD03691]
MPSIPIDAQLDLALVSPFLLQTLAEVASARGVSGERLCLGLGFTADELQDPAQRISYRQAVSMIQRALEALPERGLGLWVGDHNVLGTLGLLGHVLSLCKTLRDAFEVGRRFQHTTGGMTVCHLQEGPEESHIEVECRLPYTDVQVFAVEEFFASVLVYNRALIGDAFQPLRFEFTHAAPSYEAEYRRLLGPNLRFGCLHNRMVIASHWLDAALPSHQPVALRQALNLLEAECAQVQQKSDLLQTVERAILRDLPSGCPIDKVAAGLNMSSRTLRRRLSEHEITFETLHEQVRRARAMSLLGNPEMPIERIAEALGYSDVRGFRRAFKRWTGRSPSACRDEVAAAH